MDMTTTDTGKSPKPRVPPIIRRPTPPKPPPKRTIPVGPRRVRIVTAEGRTLAELYPGAKPIPLADPHPEHIGKLGVIVEWLHGRTPRIRLDDGTELWGAECWWEMWSKGVVI